MWYQANVEIYEIDSGYHAAFEAALMPLRQPGFLVRVTHVLLNEVTVEELPSFFSFST
jgi:hypothetical protein